MDPVRTFAPSFSALPDLVMQWVRVVDAVDAAGAVDQVDSVETQGTGAW